MMSTTTQRFGRPSAVVAATAITVGLAAGLAAAPAAAAPQISAASQPRASVRIVDVGYDQYRVSVTGVFPMSRADAQGHLSTLGADGGTRFVLSSAEAPSRGDEIQHVVTSRGLAANSTVSSALDDTAEGLRYFRTFVVDRSVLDVDGGPVDLVDEIYVQAEFIDGDGGIRHATSDVLSARF